MNFNRVEPKWSPFRVKAINTNLKITPHGNAIDRPKEVRQVTHTFLRTLNFSIKRKINSPHSYIQLSITSNKSSTQWNKRLQAKLCPACPTGAGTGRHTWGTSLSSFSFLFPCFAARPHHRPIFVALFNAVVRLDPMEYGMLQLCSILLLTLLNCAHH